MVGVTPTNLWPYTLDFPACLAPIPNRHFYFELETWLGDAASEIRPAVPWLCRALFHFGGRANPSTAIFLDAFGHP